MCSEAERFVTLWIEWFDKFGPKQSGSAHFGDLHEEIHSDRPEERKPWRKGVNVEACLKASSNVLYAVGQRVSQFQIRRSSGLLHVIAGYGNGVKSWHMSGGKREDV